MNFINICIFLIAVIQVVRAKEPQQFDLSRIVKAVLKDPEFLSLNVKQQLRILIEINNILDKKISPQNDFKYKTSTNVLKIRMRNN
jgi:hypothetical protein